MSIKLRESLPYSCNEERFWLRPITDSFIQEIFSQVTSSELNKRIQSEVMKIRAWHSNMGNNFSELRKKQIAYLKEVNMEYCKNLSCENKVEVDTLEFYWELFNHSIIADNFYPIKFWGVDYLYNTKLLVQGDNIDNIKSINEVEYWIKGFEKTLIDPQDLFDSGYTFQVIACIEFLLVELKKLKVPVTLSPNSITSEQQKQKNLVYSFIKRFGLA